MIDSRLSASTRATRFRKISNLAQGYALFFPPTIYIRNPTTNRFNGSTCASNSLRSFPVVSKPISYPYPCHLLGDHDYGPVLDSGFYRPPDAAAPLAGVDLAAAVAHLAAAVVAVRIPVVLVGVGRVRDTPVDAVVAADAVLDYGDLAAVVPVGEALVVVVAPHGVHALADPHVVEPHRAAAARNDRAPALARAGVVVARPVGAALAVVLVVLARGVRQRRVRVAGGFVYPTA